MKSFYFILSIMLVITLSSCKKESSDPTSPKGNKPPLIVSYSISNLSIAVGGSVEIEIVAEDPEGEMLSYDWSKPSKGLMVDINGGFARFISHTNGEEKIVCKIKDIQGAEVEKSFNLVISIGGSSPIFQSLNSAKSTIGVNERITIYATATHPLNQFISYIWSTNASGALLTSHNTATFIPFIKGKALISCTARSQDGNQAAKTIEFDVVETQNKPPIIEWVKPEKDTVKINTAVTITCKATDPEGGKIS
ncbi:MAG: hypothetical protein FJW56_08335, partial [Actinobacteria bacterium]|nr:hypothetical protein [Actinomycetota bacterium]